MAPLCVGLDPSPLRLGEMPDRFVTKVAVADGGCWIWTAACTKGYGQFKVNGRQFSAHRVAYEALVGPIPEGLVIDHLCRQTRCVNPAHMEVVTVAENTRRGDAGANERTKTHCPQGHPYDENNTYLYRGKWRRCRICSRADTRRWYAKNRKSR